MDEGILEVDVAGDRVIQLRGVGELHGVGLITCEVGVVVQGDEGPFCGVAHVVDCHGVTVGHQEKEEEEEQQEEVEGEGEKQLKDDHTWMECGWNEKTSASGLEPCGVMNELDEDTTDCVQVCSILHVAHVYVRRVIHVIALTVVEGVLVVVHTFT